jgi:hypothetical protein
VVVPVQAPDDGDVVDNQPLRVDRPVPARWLRGSGRQEEVFALGYRVQPLGSAWFSASLYHALPSGTRTSTLGRAARTSARMTRLSGPAEAPIYVHPSLGAVHQRHGRVVGVLSRR